MTNQELDAIKERCEKAKNDLALINEYISNANAESRIDYSLYTSIVDNLPLAEITLEDDIPSLIADIDRLQTEREEMSSELKRMRDQVVREGFNDLATMIAKFKTVMLAANELSIETDEELEELRAKLSISQRRTDAAVENLCQTCESLANATACGGESGCHECEWYGTSRKARRETRDE